MAALARAGLERPQTPGGDPAVEDRLYAGLTGPGWSLLRAAWPGGIEWRTQFFDDVTLLAIGGSIAQVVILGAGYDGRAFRFCAPGVRFFEVDHPVTQADKRRRVEAVGGASNEITYVAHDLAAHGLTKALSRAGHDLAQPTLFLCEGVLLYLPRRSVSLLLHGLRERAAHESQLALTAREILPTTSFGTRARHSAQRLFLAAAGEPPRSLFQPGELREVIIEAGWTIARERNRTVNARTSRLLLLNPEQSP